MSTGGSSSIIGSANKLIKIEGHLFSVCGDFFPLEIIPEWYISTRGMEGEERFESFPKSCRGIESSVVGVSPKGKLFIVQCENGHIESYSKPMYFSAGSGERFAYGAMYAGATSKEAVKAAIKYDPYTGGRVRTITLGE